MAQDNDPVGNGFVASLARPGGNITGLSALYTELDGKRLELLKEVVPGLSRVAVFGSSSEPGNARALRDGTRGEGSRGGPSIPGRARAQGHGGRVPRREPRACGRCPDAVWSGPPPSSAGRLGNQKPASGHECIDRGRGGRGAHVLWGERDRSLPARRHLRGQDPQGRQARRPAGRAADQV